LRRLKSNLLPALPLPRGKRAGLGSSRRRSLGMSSESPARSMRRCAEMSEIDVARTDGFRDDLANRSRVIREAAGRGKPLMETAVPGWGLRYGAGAGGTLRMR
jgi:hypothetical protein